MKSEWELKRQIVEIGKRIWIRGYVAANDGNITVKLNDKEILTTPTGVSKGFMEPGMIIKVDHKGNVLSGNSNYKPSSELKMHLEVYKERPDIESVVHAHPQFATSFAVAGLQLNKCVLPEAILVIGAVPIAKYGLPSTMEIPDAIREHIKNSDVILLENHGALTLGTDLLNAYHKMETLEHTASIVWKSLQLGNMNVLPEYERDRLMALRSNYNLKGRVSMCDSSPVSSTSESFIKAKEITSSSGRNEINETLIKEITEKVLAKIKAKNY